MKVFVVDDEAPARERLHRLLLEIGPTVEWVGEACDGLEAIRACAELRPEVILLDIHMPVLDGLQCARQLACLPEPPAVIFTTAFEEYALEAFHVSACDYLLKPVRREDLHRALNRAARFSLAHWQQLSARLPGEILSRERICARLGNEIKLIEVADIRYFHADQKYTTVRSADGACLIEDSLRSLEQEFAEQFLRVHRATLVAFAHLEGLERSRDGVVHARIRGVPERMEISRRHLPSVREYLRSGAKLLNIRHCESMD